MTTVNNANVYPMRRNPKLAELIAQRLRREIIRGELVEGDALPSEAELMRQFGGSRATLRAAFRMLESEGLITLGRGAGGGTRVQISDGEIAARYVGLVLEFFGTTLTDVYEARRMIEVPCVRMLASRCNQVGLHQLRAAIGEARTALNDPNRLIRLHSEFHSLVIELTGNRTMTVLNGIMRDFIDLSSSAHMVKDFGSQANVRAIRKGFRAHERLVDHIEAREADAAAELWSRHLVAAEICMLGGSNPKAVIDLLNRSR